MDLLFASDSIWNWDAEENFTRLQIENPELLRAGKSGHYRLDIEKVLQDKESLKESQVERT